MVRRLLSVAILGAALAGALAVGPAAAGPGVAAMRHRALVASGPSVRVEGADLVDAAGLSVQVYGLNRSGTEYMCVGGWSVFDGASGPAVVAEMKSWHIQAVRVPLNEDCWLGVNVPAAYSGAVYRSAIEQYVAELNRAGLVAVLDLHWSAPGATVANGQWPMPDRSHSLAFWRSVGAAFRADPGVAFDLFNEPHGVSWQCWAQGCAMPGGWLSAGMQSLVDAVRSSGARQPVIVEGLDWGNDLSGFSASGITDPAHQLAAGFHVYPWSACSTTACWDSTVVPVAARVPVVATEVGEQDCSGRFVTGFLGWAADHGVSALAWTWNDNQGCLSLITGAGSSTPYGSTVRSDLARLALGENP